MKRLLLLITFIGCSLFSSCSDDNPADLTPAPPYNYLRAKINGNNLVFERSEVIKENIIANGDSYTDLVITMHKKNDTSTKIVFRVQYLTTGPDTCYYFLYNEGDAEHDIENGDSFLLNVTQSSANNIKGTFSGTLADFESNTVSIEDGTFDITF